MTEPKVNPADAKRLFAQLTAFFGPSAAAAGLALRPFSIATLDAMQLAGIAIGSASFAELPDERKARQLYALIVIQTADLGALGKALRAANGDFEAFYWDFVFERAASIPFEAMLDVQEQLDSEMPAIEAAQVEVITPPSMKGTGEKPPPNS